MTAFKKILIVCCSCVLAVFLCSCGSSSSSSTSESAEYSGTNFTLGNLNITVYDQEIVHDTGGNDCLAIYLHVSNRGTDAESVMGTYNIKRNQGTSGTLKVAVAYDTNGNTLHTANTRIDPGESADVVMCFKLVSSSPVTVVFGNANRGVEETTLTFKVTE